jgi:hypothetical protein
MTGAIAEAQHAGLVDSDEGGTRRTIATRQSPMTPLPLITIVGGMFAIVLVVPFGLYALLTRSKRRTTREIRTEATQRGWQYRSRRWQGNPTAFRIDGRTRSGLAWVLSSGGSGSDNRGWNAELNLLFPILGGEVDFAVLPRITGAHSSVAISSNLAEPGAEPNRIRRTVEEGPVG